MEAKFALAGEWPAGIFCAESVPPAQLVIHPQVTKKIKK